MTGPQRHPSPRLLTTGIAVISQTLPARRRRVSSSLHTSLSVQPDLCCIYQQPPAQKEKISLVIHCWSDETVTGTGVFSPKNGLYLVGCTLLQLRLRIWELNMFQICKLLWCHLSQNYILKYYMVSPKYNQILIKHLGEKKTPTFSTRRKVQSALLSVSAQIMTS